MAITKERKKEILAQVADIISNASSMVFVGFHGLSAEETVELRQTLKREEVRYLVAKKRLIKKAIEDSALEGALPELSGELALAYTLQEDTTAPARHINTFVKKHEGMEILGGVFENALIDAATMQEIATIPSTDVLRGMFVNVINSPIQGLAVALGQIAEKKEASA